jgi:enoyl-CoA hydratase/carnithine racemase
MLTLSLLDELIRVLQSLKTEQCGCLIISGGNHVFSVGADPKQLLALETCEEVLERLSQVNDLITKFEGITIAAIAGYALGGGAELALACDFIVGNESSRIGFPEVSLGIIPGGGATVRLPLRVGVAKSIELILTGRVLTGSDTAIKKES